MKKIGAWYWTVIAGVVIATLKVTTAAADSTLPTIDLKARCRTSEKAMLEILPSMEPGSAFDGCMKAEQQAQEAIAKAWPDMPQSYRSFCIRPNDCSPSYVEWIACLEMKMDLRKMRADTGRQVDYVSRRCPLIKYGYDGTIKEVSACPLQ